MKIIFLLFCISLLLWSCSSEKQVREYNINFSELSNGKTETVTIPHNAILAFPIQEPIDPQSLVIYQTKISCRQPEVYDWWKEELTSRLKPKETVFVRRISLEILLSDENGYSRVPESFCVGFHHSNGSWDWDFTPREPRIDEEVGKAFGEITRDIQNVDGIALLFDSTAAVSKVIIETK